IIWYTCRDLHPVCGSQRAVKQRKSGVRFATANILLEADLAPTWDCEAIVTTRGARILAPVASRVRDLAILVYTVYGCSKSGAKIPMYSQGDHRGHHAFGRRTRSVCLFEKGGSVQRVGSITEAKAAWDTFVEIPTLNGRAVHYDPWPLPPFRACRLGVGAG